MELPEFNRLLILSSLLITVSAAAVVSGRVIRDRMLAVAVMVQGMVMLLVAASAYFPRPELELAAVTILLVFPLWLIHLFRRGSFRDAAIPDFDSQDARAAVDSAGDPPMPAETQGDSE